MSTRKLLLKHELDFLKFKLYYNDFKIQQHGVELQAFGLELKKQKEVEQASQETPNPEGNEVNFDLPPRLDEYEEHEEETTKEEEKYEEIEESMVEKPKEKSHKDSFPTTEATTLVPLSISTPQLQISQPTTPFYSFTIKEPNLFCDFSKPSLKVSYNEFRAFKEWKLIIQAEWEAQLIKDELFE